MSVDAKLLMITSAGIACMCVRLWLRAGAEYCFPLCVCSGSPSYERHVCDVWRDIIEETVSDEKSTGVHIAALQVLRRSVLCTPCGMRVYAMALWVSMVLIRTHRICGSGSILHTA